MSVLDNVGGSLYYEEKLASLDPALKLTLSTFRCVETRSCPPELRSTDGQWQLGDFSFVRKLGQGFASHVYEAIHLRSSKHVAVKIYNKSNLTPLNVRQVEREIDIHSRLHHPNVLDLYAAFEDPSYIYLVLEYCERGDLFAELKRRRGIFSEALVVRSILQPFLCALRYLHGNGIIHRDIKPENLLFNDEKVLKVADFGLAIDKEQERPVTRLGTLDYMAPDVLLCPDKQDPDANKDLPGYDESVDAWAVGVLAYELLAGKSPFARDSRRGVYDAILAAEPTFLYTMSEEAKGFIQCALVKDPAGRHSVDRLLSHSFIQKFVARRGSLPTRVSAGLDTNPQGTPAALRVAEAAAEAAQFEATRRDSVHVPVLPAVLVRPAPLQPGQDAAPKTHRGDALPLRPSDLAATPAIVPQSPGLLQSMGAIAQHGAPRVPLVWPTLIHAHTQRPPTMNLSVVVPSGGPSYASYSKERFTRPQQHSTATALNQSSPPGSQSGSPLTSPAEMQPLSAPVACQANDERRGIFKLLQETLGFGHPSSALHLNK